MKQELKPCPFCGEQPMVSEKTLSVYCKNALCPETIAAESDNLAEAIEAWNTRHNHSGESIEISESQMRYEIAKDMMPHIYKQKAEIARAFVTNPQAHSMFTGAGVIASIAIEHANELVSQLKQHSDEK